MMCERTKASRELPLFAMIASWPRASCVEPELVVRAGLPAGRDGPARLLPHVAEADAHCGHSTSSQR
eukprot:5426415-Prymnesium_polylepis.1